LSEFSEILENKRTYLHIHAAAFVIILVIIIVFISIIGLTILFSTAIRTITTVFRRSIVVIAVIVFIVVIVVVDAVPTGYFRLCGKCVRNKVKKTKAKRLKQQ